MLHFNPTEPIRVAILPFVHVDSQGNIVMPDASLFIDRINFVSSPSGSSPADLVAGMARQKLIDRTALDLLSPPLVRSELIHHGFAAPDLSVDRARVFNSKASDLCQHHLQCDAVLFGKVLRWDRSYYGLQAVATVGLELTLISARDNQVLFTTSGEDSDSRGITKGPTGIRDLLIAPVQGLDSKIVLDLAERLVSKLLAPLTVTERPEYRLQAPPAIFGAAHSGNGGQISRDTPLVVVMAGTPGISASFSLGNKITGIPMIERRPGSYTGVFFPLPSDTFTAEKLVVSLVDDFGRTSKLQVDAGSFSLK